MTDPKQVPFSISKFLEDHRGLSDISVPVDLSLDQSKVVEGVLVDDPSKTMASDYAVLPTLDVENWLGFMDSSPSGFDPVLRDFVKAHPESISLVSDNDSSSLIGHEGDAHRLGTATPREWTKLSDLAKSANSGLTHAETGKEWAFPVVVVTAIVGPDLTNSIIDFARDKGIQVVTTPQYQHMGISNMVLDFIATPTDYSQIGSRSERKAHDARTTRGLKGPETDEPSI